MLSDNCDHDRPPEMVRAILGTNLATFGCPPPSLAHGDTSIVVENPGFAVVILTQFSQVCVK